MTAILHMNRRKPIMTQPFRHWTVLPHGKLAQWMAAGNHEEALLRIYVMGIGCQ